ncbi:hypothetical protein CASFOL_001073 [Castilleja foliolosa]|uniref:C2H2-type domain-containing protein n=1 Tax=Castilleja foliolosa TaxID=1961234 RepID=A0ABD3EM44_9LAMI
MSSSSPMELAIQKELMHRRKKVPCPKKEVVTTLTRSPSFLNWTNTGSISEATAQGYLALHKEPCSPILQSPPGFPRLPSPSPRPQNSIGQKPIKDEPYSIEPPPRASPNPEPIQVNTACFQPQSPNPFASVPTKPRSGRKRKGEENEQSRAPKKHVDSLVCELCQATCSSAVTMQQHLKGRAHKAKLEWYKLNRDRGGPGTNKPMCNVCKIWCSDRNSLEMHFKGQRHKSKVQEMEACKRNGGAEIDKKPILCEMCGVHCMNEDLFKMHLKGKQHAFKAREML